MIRTSFQIKVPLVDNLVTGVTALMAAVTVQFVNVLFLQLSLLPFLLLALTVSGVAMYVACALQRIATERIARAVIDTDFKSSPGE